jgi:hypothetical protein
MGCSSCGQKYSPPPKQPVVTKTGRGYPVAKSAQFSYPIMSISSPESKVTDKEESSSTTAETSDD